MKKKETSAIFRMLLQILFFALSMAILGFVIVKGSKAIHNICPYAMICFGLSPSQLLSGVGKLFLLGNLIGFGVLISTLFIGRKFCSYICPLGTYQEALFRIRSRRYRFKQILPYYLEKRLGKLRYLILALTITAVVTGTAYLYIKLCPFFGLSQLPSLAVSALVLLLGITITGLILERFWCRFLCPFAALMNIFQGLGKLFGIKRLMIMRNIERCNDCGLCQKYCPVNINIAEDAYIKDPDCIHCGLCASACPKDCMKLNCKETE